MVEMLVLAAVGMLVLVALAVLIGTLSKSNALDDGWDRLALARRGLGERVRLLDRRELALVEREQAADVREARLDRRERILDRRDAGREPPR
jgi:hypothetical protein